MLQVYYHNNDTKESVWTVPKELQDIKDRIEAEAKVNTFLDKGSSLQLIFSQKLLWPPIWVVVEGVGVVC